MPELPITACIAHHCWLCLCTLAGSLTCSVGVAALHILEGAAAVDDEIFSPSAEMHKVQGAEEEGLYDKVSVTDSIHGVGAHPPKEAQLLSDELPVHPKGVACQCTCRWTQASPSPAPGIASNSSSAIDCLKTYMGLPASGPASDPQH